MSAHKKFLPELPQVQQVENWLGRKKFELVKLEHEIAMAENWMHKAAIRKVTKSVKQKYGKKN